MRFSAQLPTDRVDAGSELLSARAIGEMAAAAEGAGFDACYVTEHPFPPDEWLSTGGHHALDPFVSLTAAACATTTLRLHTNILVLPYRNPFLTAKAVASLDVVSGGRVIMGVGVGYLEGEYRALGADFAGRGRRTDEALRALTRAWSEDSVEMEGEAFRVAGNTMRPRPVQQPHPPIWVGGNSRPAIRRVVQYGQAWCPFPLPRKYSKRTGTDGLETVAELGERIGELRARAEAAGRSDPIDVNFVPFGTSMNRASGRDAGAFCAQLEELREAGVTWVSIGMPSGGRAEYLDEAARFGAEIISRFR